MLSVILSGLAVVLLRIVRYNLKWSKNEIISYSRKKIVKISNKAYLVQHTSVTCIIRHR